MFFVPGPAGPLPDDGDWGVDIPAGGWGGVTDGGSGGSWDGEGETGSWGSIEE